MIAWWIRLGEWVAGDTPLGVRLVPTLATGVSTWLIGDIARRVGLSDRAAVRAALWYNATFTVALGGILATPDTPACFFWTLSLWCLARLWQGRNGAWWVAAGAAAGLCCLSKYSGLFLAPGVVLWLLVAPGGLPELKRPWPWIAAALAFAIFSPNLAWNAGHDWLTFDKQFGRVNADGLHPGYLPEFLAAQFLLLNPLIAVQAARGAGLGWNLRRDPEHAPILLPLALALPFILYLLVHSLHDRVQGHWPVPAFGALVICAALSAETSRPWVRRAVPVLGLGLAAAVLVYAAVPEPGAPGVSDPTLALRNWSPFARDVETLRKRQGATWVGVVSYGVLAQLRTEPQIRAPVVQITDRDRYFDWDQGGDFAAPGLVLDLERRLRASDLKRCFASVTPAGALVRGPGPARSSRYAVFRVQGPRRDLIGQGCPWPA